MCVSQTTTNSWCVIFGENSLRFGEYHIYFTNILPKELLKKIANADSEVRRSDVLYIRMVLVIWNCFDLTYLPFYDTAVH